MTVNKTDETEMVPSEAIDRRTSYRRDRTSYIGIIFGSFAQDCQSFFCYF